jgi:hypothetical protein
MYAKEYNKEKYNFIIYLGFASRIRQSRTQGM